MPCLPRTPARSSGQTVLSCLDGNGARRMAQERVGDSGLLRQSGLSTPGAAFLAFFARSGMRETADPSTPRGNWRMDRRRWVSRSPRSHFSRKVRARNGAPGTRPPGKQVQRSFVGRPSLCEGLRFLRMTAWGGGRGEGGISASTAADRSIRPTRVLS